MSWESRNSGRQKIGEIDETKITRNSPWKIHQRPAFSIAWDLGKFQ